MFCLAHDRLSEHLHGGLARLIIIGAFLTLVIEQDAAVLRRK